MRRARVIPFLALALVCVGCDHATKIAAEAWLASRAPVELAGGIVRFELAYNAGAFLSIGAGLPLGLRNAIFAVIVPLGVIAASLFLLRDSTLRAATWIALGLLAGGGVANGIDRILNGGFVTDFVSIGIGSLRTGIFNVADLAVIAGAAGMALLSFQPDRGEAETPRA